MRYTKSTQVKKKKKIKTKVVISLPQLKAKVQRVFNKWIRERDKDLPCISCQGFCGAWNAGHFWPMGSKSALRYTEDNCHKQGVGCNKYKSGNLSEYRINLIKKIGIERVNWLEEHRNDTKIWTREELNKLIVQYKYETL